MARWWQQCPVIECVSASDDPVPCRPARRSWCNLDLGDVGSAGGQQHRALQRPKLDASAASSNADSLDEGSKSWWSNPPIDDETGGPRSSSRRSVSSAPSGATWHRPSHGGTEEASSTEKRRRIASMDRLGLNLVARMQTKRGRGPCTTTTP